jgi:hypothetical protein
MDENEKWRRNLMSRYGAQSDQELAKVREWYEQSNEHTRQTFAKAVELAAQADDLLGSYALPLHCQFVSHLDAEIHLSATILYEALKGWGSNPTS